MKRTISAATFFVLLVLSSPLLAQAQAVVSTTPGQNALNVPGQSVMTHRRGRPYSIPIRIFAPAITFPLD